MIANTDSLILDRLVAPADDDLSPQAARGLLAIRFKPDDVARMSELAAIARDRPLTSAEREEMESYNRIGHFLALVHSKARLALKAAEGAGGG